MGNTRMLAVHGDHVYATRRTEGDVIRLNDADTDETFEDFTIVAARPGMHGIAFHGDTVYLTPQDGRIHRFGADGKAMA